VEARQEFRLPTMSEPGVPNDWLATAGVGGPPRRPLFESTVLHEVGHARRGGTWSAAIQRDTALHVTCDVPGVRRADARCQVIAGGGGVVACVLSTAEVDVVVARGDVVECRI